MFVRIKERKVHPWGKENAEANLIGAQKELTRAENPV